jgi:signal transduction histidine kinase
LPCSRAIHRAYATLLDLLARGVAEHDLVQRAIETLAEVIGARYCAVGVLDATGAVAQFIHTGVSRVTAERIGRPPQGKGLLGVVVEENRALRLAEIGGEPRAGGFPPHHPLMRTLLAVPISADGWVYGRLYLCDRSDGEQFTGEDERLVTGFAHALALMLATTRAREERDRALRELGRVADARSREAWIGSAVARVAHALIPALDTPRLLDRLCTITADVLDCDTSHTLLWHAEDDMYCAVAAHGATPVEDAAAQGLRIPREALSVLFGRDRHDVAELRDMVLRSAEGSAARPRSFLCMALRIGHELAGAQVVARRDGGPYSAEHQRIARGVAQIASIALANARLLEQLEQTNRYKSEFVSTMSHELRTPLNVILGFAEMLRDPAFEQRDREEFVQRIEVAGRQLLDLVDTTLLLGRLELGRDEVRAEAVALRPLLRDLREECADFPRNADVALEWPWEPPDAALVTDPRKVAMILRNLIGNALKFTERGRVRVKATRSDAGVRFEVSDTGIGIPADQLPTIFEMFRQLDGSPTRRFGGVGLGLHIVARLMKLLGGSISVTSTVGVGSTFVIDIPSLEPPHRNAAA